MNSTNFVKNSTLREVILRSVLLAVGFAIIILACIDEGLLPFYVGLIFAFANLPIGLAEAFTSNEDYEFSFEPTVAAKGVYLKEVGQFTTAILTMSGFILPLVLLRSHLIRKTAAILALLGGVFIYISLHHLSSYLNYREEDLQYEETQGSPILKDTKLMIVILLGVISLLTVCIL